MVRDKWIGRNWNNSRFHFRVDDDPVETPAVMHIWNYSRNGFEWIAGIGVMAFEVAACNGSNFAFGRHFRIALSWPKVCLGETHVPIIDFLFMLATSEDFATTRGGSVVPQPTTACVI
jgi:hypothetical protein